MYSALDEFVLTNIGEYNGRKIVNAESKDVKIDSDSNSEAKSEHALSDDVATNLGIWMKSVLPNKVSEVGVTHRLADSPAIITDHESGVSFH